MFELFMFIILIINSVIVICSAGIKYFPSKKVITDEDTLAIFDNIDDYCLYFYILEFAIKIIGLGIEKYWENSWNKFDAGMIVLSIASNLLIGVLNVLKQAKTAKAGKLLRLTKLNRVFKIFRALRTIKFVNFLVIGA